MTDQPRTIECDHGNCDDCNGSIPTLLGAMGCSCGCPCHDRTDHDNA